MNITTVTFVREDMEKLSMRAILTFAAMNLKKMANWLWKTPKIA